MCHAIPEPVLAPHKIKLAKRTHELPEAVEAARVEPGAYLAESQNPEVAGQ